GGPCERERATGPDATVSQRAGSGVSGRKEKSMASIRKEILIEARPEAVWDAVRDVGAVHERLAPGFVVDTRLEDGARIVTFASGLAARAMVVDVAEAARQL